MFSEQAGITDVLAMSSVTIAYHVLYERVPLANVGHRTTIVTPIRTR